MAKPKAPTWLREAFRDGVDDREMVYADGVERFRKKARPYAGANPWCWLAQFDPKQLPCAGQDGHLIERFHFLRRQSVEDALWALLPDAGYFPSLPDDSVTSMMDRWDRDALILLAAWDARNGGLACEHHHRRADKHAGSPRAPSIDIPAFNLPEHVDDFVNDWGLWNLAERTFTDYEPDGDRARLWVAG